MEHYIVEKRHCTLCFWSFERRKLKYPSKTSAEVTPTDVYIMRSRSVPGVLCPHAHFWVHHIYSLRGYLSVRSMGRLPTAKMTERAAGDTLVFFYIVANQETKNPLTLGYQSDHLLLADTKNSVFE